MLSQRYWHYSMQGSSLCPSGPPVSWLSTFYLCPIFELILSSYQHSNDFLYWTNSVKWLDWSHRGHTTRKQSKSWHSKHTRQIQEPLQGCSEKTNQQDSNRNHHRVPVHPKCDMDCSIFFLVLFNSQLSELDLAQRGHCCTQNDCWSPDPNPKRPELFDYCSWDHHLGDHNWKNQR